jgi:BirA family transcriptional regulator, biotin operon repressor / biotin---[acetyl-CoA-carboxylase] ligase
MKITEGKGLLGARLLEFESLPSTNQWAMENIGTIGHGDVVWASIQTAGKGRFDRKWISPENRCLTISVIIKSNPAYEALITIIAQITALAVTSTLERFSIPAMVKWPNDVMVNGRKIAGILAELDSNNGFVVLGIGLNINMTANDFKAINLIYPATSMKIETNHHYDVRQVLKLLLVELENIINSVTSKNVMFPVETWSKKDYLKDQLISIQISDTTISGQYTGLDKSGRLRLVDNSGREHLFWSGDVTLRQEQ